MTPEPLRLGLGDLGQDSARLSPPLRLADLPQCQRVNTLRLAAPDPVGVALDEAADLTLARPPRDDDERRPPGGSSIRAAARPRRDAHLVGGLAGYSPSQRRTTMHALWPPKPNEFETAIRTSWCARLVRDVVEVALGVRRLLVDRRRHLAVARRQDAEDRLDRAGRAEAVAGGALRRGDRCRVGLLLAERELQHTRLGRVADRRRGAVRVDVVDLGRVDPRVGERHPHRAGRVLAGRVGLGHVQRVGGDAVAHQLRVDPRAARLRVLELLEHDHRARLAHHEAVALRRRRGGCPASGRRCGARAPASR